MRTFLELAAERYSVRSFSQKPIEAETLRLVLEAARIAPTACNNQPQRIKIIMGGDDLAKADECTPCRFNAPVVLLVCYDKTVCWTHPENSSLYSGEIDASIATTHLMMAAQDAGLGSCWVMRFERDKAAKIFALPENIVPVAMLPIGYKADDAAPSGLHSRRPVLEKILL
ncbi:MAG: nitroreductase family protein [Chitinispirillia bacterium]|nr:nitroreductase family protein [Chitinispirillia bacterium]